MFCGSRIAASDLDPVEDIGAGKVDGYAEAVRRFALGLRCVSHKGIGHVTTAGEPEGEKSSFSSEKVRFCS